MKVDYNPYEGRKVKGKATTVLSRGEVVVDLAFDIGIMAVGAATIIASVYRLIGRLARPRSVRYQ